MAEVGWTRLSLGMHSLSFLGELWQGADSVTAFCRWRPTKFVLDKLLQLGDPDGDGTVDFDEFVTMMTTKLSGVVVGSEVRV